MLTCLQIVLMDELIVCKPCGITFFPKNFFLLEKNVSLPSKWAHLRIYAAILLLLLVILPIRSATKRALLIGISEYPEKAHGVRSAVRLTQVLSPRLIRWVQKKPLSLGGHTFVNFKSNLWKTFIAGKRIYTMGKNVTQDKLWKHLYLMPLRDNLD